MKKPVGIVLGAIVLMGLIVLWNLFGPTVKAPEKDGYLYVKTGTDYPALKSLLKAKGVLNGFFFFDRVAERADFTGNVKPGKYKIENGSSTVSLVRMLKRGRQEPVRFTITKLRTVQDLAAKMGKNLEQDSAASLAVLKDVSFLKTLGLDTNTVMTAVIPNTYNINWTNTPKEVLTRLKQESEIFWNKKREQQLDVVGLTKDQAYILASIVEEETNSKKDKPIIASVYINRVNKGMRLEADPTVKFAMKNFGLKRILYGHLKYPSPYNTYQNTGIPPGPICTPSINTIDAVLAAPRTDFIFFVADPSLDGSSIFAATYAEHKLNAKAYQNALDAYLIKKNQTNKTVE